MGSCILISPVASLLNGGSLAVWQHAETREMQRIVYIQLDSLVMYYYITLP